MDDDDDDDKRDEHPEPLSANTADMGQDDDLHDDHHDDDTDEDSEIHHGHRGIPTWEEGIGFIVATNMEARAKNPNAGSSPRRGRGNWGRGKGRVVVSVGRNLPVI